ncbi:MAG: leucyl aminopeptidase [Malacoplasma sp.]
MITLNKSNLGLELRAIDVKDSLNHCDISLKPKAKYQCIVNEKTILFIVDKKEFDPPRLYENLKTAIKTTKKSFNVNIDSFISLLGEKNSLDIILNVVIATSFYEKVPFSLKTTKSIEISINYILNTKFSSEFKEVEKIRDSHFFCRSLQDMPSNILDPITFVEKMKVFFKDVNNVKISILNKKQIKAEKMGLFLSVNAGSITEPRLVVIEYRNNKSSNELLGYIGKGITFDSGGMNIKTGANMRHMKFDMSGAAIVISTIYALAKNNIKTNVVAIAALTENLVNPSASRPDDVVIAHNGKSVEIDNTDAEGRLVLADALSYAVTKFKVTKLIDVATLTGAMIYSLGDTYSGVWATNEDDWSKFSRIAFNSGEYVWRLPFHEEFRKPLDSKVADIANSCSNPKAGSSRAACFLKEFTHNTNYIHLDVGCTADVDDIGQAVMLRTLYFFAKEQ